MYFLQHIFFRCKLASRGAAPQGDMIVTVRRDAEEASMREADALATVAGLRRQLSVLEAGMTMERAARDVAVAHVVELRFKFTLRNGANKPAMISNTSTIAATSAARCFLNLAQISWCWEAVK